jgi:FMN-dependent oxidoreductase (nitrilotriacetate monooxygenase family)
MAQSPANQSSATPATPRHIKLGFILHGVGRTWNDWRHPGRDINASTSLAYYQRQAASAERGKFDFLFVADSLSITEKSSPHYLNRFEPITILSALAATTSRIGLVATLTVSYSEPFNVARQFASLDHLSGGRAGWNIVTSWLGDTAANFSKTEHPPHNVRYRIAGEYLDVVQGLWDSWEEDAHVADKESGQFVDPDRLHRLDHKGEFFQVRGPLNIKRTPQGQPVIFQAGASEDGRNFAARRAEVIFTHAETQEQGQAYYADVKARAKGFGRNPDQLFILPGIAPIIGDTDDEADALYRELAALESIDTGLGFLSRTFNDHDFRQYDLDAPFPDVGHIGLNSQQSGTLRILAEVRAENLTLRQVAERLASPRGVFVGAAETVADRIQHWFESGTADGFVLFEPLPGQLDIFVDKVIPILQARGLFREEYEGTTFRAHLGLAEPDNRYGADKRAKDAA